jgi:putative membrane protein
VFYQHLTFKFWLSVDTARRIARVDAVYGIAAQAVLGVGLSRIGYEKGWVYYSHNSYFWIKMGAFATVALLSVYPTITFLGWRKNLREHTLPAMEIPQVKRITWLLRLQLLGLLVVLWAAAMMAKGG